MECAPFNQQMTNLKRCASFHLKTGTVQLFPKTASHAWTLAQQKNLEINSLFQVVLVIFTDTGKSFES
jgi:hypothetical protein